MRSSARSLVSASLLLASLAAPTSGLLNAQALDPVEATEHLAKARAIDEKCRYLSEREHDELADYSAKAEVVVANKQGVETASGAVKTGKLAGEQMSCGSVGEELVRSSLAAGRQSLKGAAVARTNDAEPTPQRRARILGGIGGNDQDADAWIEPGTEQSQVPLARYRQEATAYYLELRCRHLPDRNVEVFWGRIVERHRAMIDRHGGQRVMRVQAQAERLAARRPCGRQSALFIEDAFAGLR